MSTAPRLDILLSYGGACEGLWFSHRDESALTFGGNSFDTRFSTLQGGNLLLAPTTCTAATV